jgi:hypothetical protein
VRTRWTDIARSRIWTGAVRSAVLVLVLVAAAVGEAQPVVVDLPLRGGELPRDKRLVRVRQGDEVALRWTTDKPIAIHLHGYDIEKALSPGAPATMQFRARATGRFPVEVHAHGRDGGRTIGYVEVHPR